MFDCRASRLLAASAIVAAAGLAGLAQAQDTDWSALDQSGWGKEGQSAPEAPEAASPAPSQFSADVSAAFQNLGMAAARADCYGRVLNQKVKPKHQDDVVQLLRTSEEAGDVRRKVTSKGFDIIGGFRSASKACPEQTGS